MTNWNKLTKRQKIRRWEGVLRVLKKLTTHERRKHFDMSDWLYSTECGTVGCAAGHCALDPSFRRQGFKATITLVPADIRDFPGECEYRMPNVARFFGEDGCHRVFYRAGANYSETVQNVKSYIADLKAGVYDYE